MIHLNINRTVRLLFTICLLLGSLLNPTSVAQAQEPGTVEITFEQLGYMERTLQDPYSAARYYFILPADWQPIDGGFVKLHLNFSYSGIDYIPSNELVIRLNGQVLLSTTFEQAGESTLQFALPKQRLFSPDTGLVNMLELQFTAFVDCKNNADAQVLLVIRDSSLLHFAYETQPLVLDLGKFPAPLYVDNALFASQVGFVLPEKPNSAELKAASMTAARLGASSRNNAVLSVSSLESLESAPESSTNLVVIGTPDTNPLIAQLILPAPVQQRTLELRSKMPATVIPGQAFAIIVTVKNTSTESKTLTLLDRFSDGTTIDCSDVCTEVMPNVFRWELNSLDVNQEATVEFLATIDGSVGSEDGQFEHTASLLDQTGSVLNADSLSASITSAATAEATTQTVESPAQKGKYFFMWNGEAVAEGDGIVQEIVSPLNSSKVIIVVTGLNENAIEKAGQAISTIVQFPGMSGPVARIKSVIPSSETSPVLGENITFGSLGYQDIKASFFDSFLQLNFNIPPGWAIDNNAALMLHYSYSSAMSTLFSSLEVGINGLPLKSILLENKDRTENLWNTVSIPKSYLKSGSNRLSLNLIGDYPKCLSYQVAQSFWAQIFSDSYLHLPHTIVPVDFKLEQFPYIFSAQPDLSNIAFALPSEASQERLQQLLSLASFLGYSAGGNQFRPTVVQGEVPAGTFSGFNIIAFGRPSENQTISVLNDYLPQSFEPGTDTIIQSLDNIVYRMPDNYELGYVQLIPSPWNNKNAALVITGTTDKGVMWSLGALLNENMNYKLKGNLAILVNESDLRTMDTPATVEDLTTLLSNITPDATDAPEVMNTPQLIQTTTSAKTPPLAASRSGLLIPLLSLSILIIIVTIYVTRRRR